MANLPSGPGGDPAAGNVKADPATVGKWALGVAGTWVVLTLLVDLEDTADLAVALAILVVGSSLVLYGKQAMQNIGVLQ